jgi:signal transduction histidine kinase
MRRTSETGTRLGELGSLILNGARPADLPIEAARLVPTFDWRQIQRWGIDASLLPPGSDVQFRVPTVWEAYRVYAIGTLVVVTAQLLLIAALLTERTLRRGAEQALVRREATIRTSYERIRELAGRLINAQEAARAEVARDLHDGVGQRLAEVSMDIGSLKRSSAHREDAHTQHMLSKIQGDTREVYEEIRRLSHELHPATLRLLGLATAVKAYCVEVAKRHAVEVSFTGEGDLARVDPDVAVCLFRIVQESLRNGIVHGGARRLAVSLAGTGEEIELKVTDDGKGFDLEAVRTDGSGLGLVSIEERVHAFGGDVQIVTGLQQGTTIRVRAPAARRPDDGTVWNPA